MNLEGQQLRGGYLPFNGEATPNVVSRFIHRTRCRRSPEGACRVADLKLCLLGTGARIDEEKR
jgi:hypothetical protein